MAKIGIRPLSSALGVEITGVDLREEVTDEDFALIEKAWFENLVILFRNQDLTIEQQRSFSGRFGPLSIRARKQGVTPEAAEYGGDVMLVTNVRKDGKPIGSLPDGEMMFHSDTPYFERPCKATVLYAMEVPSRGGNTLFGNSYKAAATLPDNIKRRLAGLKAMQVYEHGTTVKVKDRYDRDNFPHYAHPVFRRHSATGKSSLFVSELMTEEIIGLPADESDAILQLLFAHQRKPEFVYEHVWQPGDLIIWDNRCTIHARTDFPPEERRMLRRLTIQDDQPVVPGEPPFLGASE
jgi:taurine dioxygenase